MKKRSIFLIVFGVFLFQKIISQAKNETELSKHIINFQNLFQNQLKKESKLEHKFYFEITELTDSTNTKELSVYQCNYTNEISSNIIIIQNDSVEIYDIFAINALISRIVNLSTPSDEKKILWIKKILNIHLETMQNTNSDSWIIVEKHDNYKYYMLYNKVFP